jgi:branched-chain amino acid transport system substrate-binding protein
MKKPIIFFVLIVIVVILLVLIIKVPKGANEIVIGAALPLSDEGAPYGEASMNAIALAVDKFNEQGGIDGKKINVIYEDTKLSPTESLNAIRKLIAINKVPVIIGPMSSSQVEAVLPFAEQNNVVIVSPAATDHKLSGRSKFFFRTIVYDTYEGQVMSDFICNKMGIKNLTVFYMKSAGPEGVSLSLIKSFEKLRGHVVLIETFEQDTTDFRTQLTKIKDSNANAVFFAGFAKETGRMLIQAKELGLNKQIFAHQTAESPEVREIAGEAANGIIFASSQLPPDRSEAIRTFYESYKSKFGIEPQNYAANTYDAAMIVLSSIKKHGYNYKGILRGLNELQNYEGASGNFTMIDSGDVIGPMVIKKIEGNKVVLYE